MKPCIFVISYPNTENKSRILEDCIIFLRESVLPIVSVSNISPPEEIYPLIEDCIVGENEECIYQEFFTDDEIDKARNSSKYLLHFTPPDGITLSYRNFFSYGRGSTYHWATLSQLLKIIKYSREKEFTHLLIIEGDTVLEKEDVPIVPDIFLQMEREKLDFIISLQQNMGHMSGNAWFTTTDFWEKVCFEMSKEDFLKSTYPSFSCEEYMISRMKKVGGRGNLLMWDSDSYLENDFPTNWNLVKRRILGSDLSRSINLFFPRTTEIGLSFSIDRKDQSPSDPLYYVWMGTGKREDTPVFFIWNRYNGETVKEIKAKISIFDGGSCIFHSEFNLFPGGWAWSPIFNLKRNSHCAVEILVVDVNGEEFTFSDRFGSVGDSIDMRNLILE